MARLITPNQVALPTETAQYKQIRNPLQPLDTALQRIFSSPQEETRLQKARRVMGKSVTDVADEDLEVYLTEFQYLIDDWLDTFEQQIFDGMTLKQVLGQE